MERAWLSRPRAQEILGHSVEKGRRGDVEMGMGMREERKCIFWSKVWLTQEADAESWSSLKHLKPKEGRKE